MWQCNYQMWENKKNKETIKYQKNTIICDVGTSGGAKNLDQGGQD